jgi:hypothetical protein
MAKIKIVDLPTDMKISSEEMKKVFGGAAKSLTQTQYVNPFDVTSQLGYSNPLGAVDYRVAPKTILPP